MTDADDIKHISTFLNDNHLLALCALDEGEMWSANCFYVADTDAMTLYFMTELKTQHGRMMHKDPQVVGTIATQPESIALIRGIQYRGEAVILSGEQEQAARQRYCQQFPIAVSMPAPIWALKLNEIKMTDNQPAFGTKLRWQRTKE